MCVWRSTDSPAPAQIRSSVTATCNTSFVQHKHMKKKRTKTWHLHLPQAKFQMSAASWVISQRLCQSPTISVAIFPKLLSCMGPSPELDAAEQPHHTVFLSQHSASVLGIGQTPWMWGCSQIAPLSKCSFTWQCEYPLCVLHQFRHPSHAAQTMSSWRKDAFNPTRSFFELEQDKPAN